MNWIDYNVTGDKLNKLQHKTSSNTQLPPRVNIDELNILTRPSVAEFDYENINKFFREEVCIVFVVVTFYWVMMNINSKSIVFFLCCTSASSASGLNDPATIIFEQILIFFRCSGFQAKISTNKVLSIFFLFRCSTWAYQTLLLNPRPPTSPRVVTVAVQVV